MLLKRILKACLRFLLKVRNFRSGQIKRHHEVGKWIEFLSSLAGIDSIVEIGTWNGAGSSMAIARGVVSRPKHDRDKVQVFGYEINPAMAKAARRRLARFGFFDVIFGSLVSIDDLDRSNLTHTEESWLKQDERWILGAPNVFNSLPQNLDLLILDGGEFSTLAEFKLLKDRVSHWIILDDTNTRKCAQILKIIESEEEFLLVYQSQERNGTAILKRIKQ
jgi:hypothetical protein